MTDTEVAAEEKFAGIQYYGLAGVTSGCLDGIVKLIHFGDAIREAKLLSHIDAGGTGTHAFILLINEGDMVAIKSGFSSGYDGTGPTGLGTALQLLLRHADDVKEYRVSRKMIERLDQSCLLQDDIERLQGTTPVRPERFTDYVYQAQKDIPMKGYDDARLSHRFPASVPFGLLDARLMDIAIGFFDDPDARLLQAFRRLESLVRQRTEIKGKSGNRLFSEAFQGDGSILYWADEDKNEHSAKAGMFTAIFGAYRNPRAHQEGSSGKFEYLKELLLVNELYLLEAKSIRRPEPEAVGTEK